MDIYEKYKFAIRCLQSIAQYDDGKTYYGSSKIRDEWSAAKGFYDCKMASINTLRRLDENCFMDNNKNKLF